MRWGLALGLCPAVARAATVTLPLGAEVYDISALGAGDTLSIPAGASVTLTGANENVGVVCGNGVRLTLQDVTIDNLRTGVLCPLAFTGDGNVLTLVGGSSLTSGGQRSGR